MEGFQANNNMLQLQFKNSEKGPLWLVEPRYIVGSDIQSDLVIDSASVMAQHIELHVTGDNIQLVNRIGRNVTVNNREIHESTRLFPSDVISIGGNELILIDPKALQRKPTVSLKVVDDASWSLKALSTALASKTYNITGVTSLGRSKECDISLSLSHLSRKHAQLSVTSDGLEIVDLNSSNGTYVNGKKVRASVLKPGDELSFDTLKFLVVGPEESGDKTVMRSSLISPAGGQKNDSYYPRPSSGRRAPRSNSKSARPKEDLHRRIAESQSPIDMPHNTRQNLAGWVVLSGLVLASVGYAIYMRYMF